MVTNFGTYCDATDLFKFGVCTIMRNREHKELSLGPLHRVRESIKVQRPENVSDNRVGCHKRDGRKQGPFEQSLLHIVLESTSEIVDGIHLR